MCNFARVPGFLQSEEFKVANGLLEAFEKHDEGLLSELQKNRSLTFLDNEFAKLALTLKIPGGFQEKEQASHQMADIQHKIEEEGFC